MNKINKLQQTELAYIAGFFDGDGCINVQIIPRADYKFKFQLRFSLTIFQKTSRHWVVLWFQKKLGCGQVRKRKDGISEFCLVGKNDVQNLLQVLKPFLKVKRRQAQLVLEICQQMSKNQDLQSFLKLCERVDQIALLNDSKKRIINAQVVRSTILMDVQTFPVETETIDRSDER